MSRILKITVIIVSVLALMSCNLNDPTATQNIPGQTVITTSASIDTTLHSGYYLNQPIRYRIMPDGNYLFAGDIELKPEWVTKGLAKLSAPGTRLTARWQHGIIP